MKKIMMELSPEMHSAFKIRCVQNNQTIKDALIELVEYYILNPKIEKKNEKHN